MVLYLPNKHDTQNHKFQDFQWSIPFIYPYAIYDLFWKESAICDIISIISSLSFLVSNCLILLLAIVRVLKITKLYCDFVQTKCYISTILVLLWLTFIVGISTIVYLVRSNHSSHSNSLCYIFIWGNSAPSLFLALSTFTNIFIT